ncbi:MAG TPA: 2-oxoglutarate dehydrogenase complex dihydrolipoyllysine-residue succinyltransferase [Gemmataceae bacterium]|nr:2-oxoglutarate dehydrogenase complex dihydrolipoyllysine-residue succinyltransferase [Gemmataceae bacterium]
MAVDIKVPSVGEAITEGVLSRWLKADGDAVREGDPVLELETDKASQEVSSPASGVLKIGVKEGQKIAIGAVVGRVEEGPGAPAQPREAAKPAAVEDKAIPVTTAAAAVEPLLSPAARQMAADAGVDPRKLAGSGRGGRIIKEDVQAFLAERAAPPPPPPARAPAPPAPPPPSPQGMEGKPPANGRETRQRMTTIRQRIAERLLAAQQNAAILTTFNEADMSAVQALRAKYKESFQKKHGVGLGFMSFFVKAAVEGLRAFPAANARIDGPDIVYHHFHDIGVAVSTEKGLMVPVLRDAGRLSFAEIEKGVAELAAKARDGKITVADLQGGTFTITNGGVFGSLLSTPILNPPQSGILGMHAIQKRPVVVNDEIVIRPMMYLAFSYDHRLIDGREAVSFLVRVKECVENPERLMLEV